MKTPNRRGRTMPSDATKEQLQREVTPELYGRIRELWKQHSMAEDGRDIPGLIATLTPDCVYEVPQLKTEWRGHAGATRFYTELLTAFPDAQFALQNIVIGPQGVCEEAVLTASAEADWLGLQATGRKVAFPVVIFFPWDPSKQLFRGERVYFDADALRAS
ncbi:MAG: nuclear transport factor 2 family protein [Gemmatimonadales bacterium]